MSTKTYQTFETQEAKLREWASEYENSYPEEVCCPISGIPVDDLEENLIPDCEILAEDQPEARWDEKGYIELLTEAYGCTYSVDCTHEQAKKIKDGEDPHSVLDNIDDYIWSYEDGTEYNTDLERGFERFEREKEEWEQKLWDLWRELFNELDPEEEYRFTFEDAVEIAKKVAKN
jgi:hypothetical protein